MSSSDNYIFNGLSQKDRKKAELIPGFVKIDDRSLSDVLEFVRRYAEEINFLSPEYLADNSVPIDNWGAFFNRDNLILLIGISNYNIGRSDWQAQQLLEKISATSNESLQSKHLNRLADIILGMAKKLDYFSTHLQQNEITSDIIFDIRSAIRGDLNEELKSLYQFKAEANWEEAKVKDFKYLLGAWNKGIPTTELLEALDKEKNSNDLQYLRQIFTVFHHTFYHIIEKSKEVLENALSEMQNSKPHIALYIAFLKLFKYAIDIQNELPKRHLDFYYRDVLKQAEEPAQPDKAFVSVDIKPEVKHHFLDKGVLLKAGTNELGEPLYYKTIHPTNLTSAKVRKVCTLLKTTDERYHQKPYDSFITDIYASETARTKEAYFSLNNLPPFGEGQVMKSQDERNMVEAKTGFVVSSHVLNLASGKRDVTITLSFEPTSFQESLDLLQQVSTQNNQSLEETIYKVFSSAFELSVSQKSSIIPLAHYGFELDRENNQWIFTVEIAAHEPPIERCESKLERQPIYEHPFVQIILKHECSLFLYSLLANMEVENIHINTQTKALKGTKLFNTFGQIDLANPFEPFGVIPQKGDYFVLGHEEIFSKKTENIDLNIQWFSLPITHGGIEAYYHEYLNNDVDSRITKEVTTANYRIKKALLKDGKWIEDHREPNGQEIFPNQTFKGVQIADAYEGEIHISTNLESLGHVPTQKASNYHFDQHTSEGFLRCSLQCPDFAFGHNSYPTILSETVQKNAQPKRKGPALKQPKLPFSPKIQKITVGYSASATAISRTKNRTSAEEVHLYELSPFGYQKKALETAGQTVKLIDETPGEGSLLLALDEYPHNGHISLLFVLNELMESDHAISPSQISMWYLRDNQWQPINGHGIMNDTTNQFINSGVIDIRIPKDINRNNTVLDDSFLWVKATIQHETLAHGRLVKIYENGILSVWNESASPIHLNKRLAPNTIEGTKDSIPQISGVVQPMPSFGGKPAEQPADFYDRVSERLRHKNRAITTQDYEELALEKYQQLYKVKCFAAEQTLDKDYINRRFIPGAVRVVVVPAIEASVNSNYPRVSKQSLKEIGDFLDKHSSPFVNTEVINAHFQKVRIICKVRFDGAESNNYYQDKIQEDIRMYLNPWLNDYKMPLVFGKRIYKSEVLTFLEQLDYVAFVTEFSLVNIKQRRGRFSFYDTAAEQTEASGNQNEIRPDFPWSILVSAQKHDITPIDDKTYQPAKPRSISNMELGIDFIVSD
ncbi:baseplate J/gp47 family protein [Roseivirga pacifica]|uniref:baseplate J/gp47 family protein n=1 Tax=Roseivirga pacifica TaxID=1267423 RepID=UPI00227B66B0